MAAIGDQPATSVDARVLREALGEVVFAAASDESRPILTGVLTKLAGDRMTLAAADNYRIAVRTLTLDKAGHTRDHDRRAGPLVRRADARSCPTPSRRSRSRSRRTRARSLFHVEGIDLVSRLIEGQFPNYEPVIPASHSSRAVIDREAFLAGTRRASIFARDSANIVKIEVGGEDDERHGHRHHRARRRRRRQRRHGRGSHRGLTDRDRLQRALPDRRAEQPRRR